MAKVVEGVDSETINSMINNETWLTGKSAKDYFKVDIVDKNAVIDNKVGNCILNCAKIPEELKKSLEMESGSSIDNKGQSDKDLEGTQYQVADKMAKEIEIALML